jgi:hypothetical protein
MRCEYHPEYEAIGTCLACGRSVCSICKVFYKGVVHCKVCIEQGNYHERKSTKPSPKGVPTKKFFTTGLIGCILTTFATFMLGISFISYWKLFDNYHPREYPILFASSLMILPVGFITFGIGLYGFYRNYGSAMGIVSSVFLFVNSIMFTILGLLSIKEEYYYNYYEHYYYFQLDYIFLLPAHIILGCAIIIVGVTFIIVKRFSRTGELSTATGAMLIVSGSLMISYIGSIVGICWLLLGVTSIICAITFFKSAVPEVQLLDTSV